MLEVETESQTFEFIGGRLGLDFANTVSTYLIEDSGERLHSYRDVISWGKEAGILSRDEFNRLLKKADRDSLAASTVLERAIALRQAIHWIFSTVAVGEQPKQADINVLNTELSQAMTKARLFYKQSGFDWGWQHKGEEMDSVLWAVARSAAELLTSDDLDLVRECAGIDCGWLFLDASRNHSRHWCNMKDCGNRAKARRHYHKKRANAPD